MRRAALWVVLALVGCGPLETTTTVAARQEALSDPLLTQLQALPGVTVTEVASKPGTRGFLLEISQPVDHFNPSSPRFTQRALLLHRDVAQPMVLASTGYGLFSPRPRDNELSFTLSANVLIVEHRYFEGSTPTPTDPRYLTIRQAAWDHHRVVELLKPVYPARWLSTGASKGGMTSIFHRRYFPNDVYATVAYVAPQTYGTNDPRYPLFLERVGSATCRQQLITFQRALLANRAELVARYEQQALDFGLTYTRVGGVPVAFEHAVQELRFALWQYLDEETCLQLPAATATADELQAAMDGIVGPADLASDQALEAFGAYYYQSAAQLGSYGPLELHLRGQLQFPGTYRVQNYTPWPVARFDAAAMPQVQAWVALFGERLMFIYGENDPWSAGAFELGAARDSFKYFVPGGNHGAAIFLLPEAQQAEANATLERWAGVPVTPLRQSGARAAPNEDLTEWQLERKRPSVLH